MAKKKILVTGGAGFVGTNLIKYLLLKTNFQIISIDNYSSGLKNNHVKNKIFQKLLKIPEISKQFSILESLQEFIKVF